VEKPISAAGSGRLPAIKVVLEATEEIDTKKPPCPIDVEGETDSLDFGSLLQRNRQGN
jgi:hypothetical protein